MAKIPKGMRGQAFINKARSQSSLDSDFQTLVFSSRNHLLNDLNCIIKCRYISLNKGLPQISKKKLDSPVENELCLQKRECKLLKMQKI